MTGISFKLRSALTPALLALAALTATASAADAPQVNAKASVVKVVESGDFIDVDLKVSVTNNDSSTASSVFVRFQDGLEISLGDVAPGQSVVSGTHTESINISALPTRHVPVPVTVKFTFGGQSIEQAQTLVVDRVAPQDPVQ